MAGLLTAVMFVATLCACASSNSAAGGRGSADFVGFTWKITEVDHDGAATPIPAQYAGSISFGPDNRLYADDGVNSRFGRYSVDGDTYQARGIGESLVGDFNPSPARQALIGAVRAATQEGVDVTGAVDGDELTLAVSGYRIVCTRDGVRPAEQPGSPTPTAVPTS